jgi:histidyl-tRNA synthetase
VSPPTGRVTPISGFPEYLPADRIVEQRFLDVIRETFELHGFSSIETRSIEPVERLSAQGEDADKEIYAVSRLGASPSDDDDARWGLHFDLTVPFARYVVENAGRLSFPFRRYQIQKAWRGERPQEGRYREFLQADIDVVDRDTLAPHHEAEMPLVIGDALAGLPVPPVLIQVNNRKVCQGFYQGVGIEDPEAALRAVDKLDKIGPAAVSDLLVETAGATPVQAKAALALAEISAPDASFADAVIALGVRDPLLDEGLAELVKVVETAREHAPGLCVADLRIARGLDYYTGTVYETVMRGYEKSGSICSGGRYDNLASAGNDRFPGVGISLGVSRMLGLLFGKDAVTISRSVPTCVLIAVTDEGSRADSDRIAAALRQRGIPCEVSPSAAKFGKQIRYAERRGIPYVWFGDEVKDIRSGEQVAADPASWTPPDEDLRPVIAAP